mmetsp:Transcript_3084/g.8885  ORF Transcript_3084/g.8885 Transcript_3084/m.8885 type:complete len:238 (+) Transcript_3084:1062-1775(+)
MSRIHGVKTHALVRARERRRGDCVHGAARKGRQASECSSRGVSEGLRVHAASGGDDGTLSRDVGCGKGCHVLGPEGGHGLRGAPHRHAHGRVQEGRIVEVLHQHFLGACSGCSQLVGDSSLGRFHVSHRLCQLTKKGRGLGHVLVQHLRLEYDVLPRGVSGYHASQRRNLLGLGLERGCLKDVGHTVYFGALVARTSIDPCRHGGGLSRHGHTGDLDAGASSRHGWRRGELGQIRNS